MSTKQRVDLAYREAMARNLGAKVYDFAGRQSGPMNADRIKALEIENALLVRAVSETRSEIERLRKLLTAV